MTVSDFPVTDNRLPTSALAPAPTPSGSSFYLAMRILPAAQRQAMYEIYAFCRAVDDIADSQESAAVRLAGLQQWRADIDACYAGQTPPHLNNLVQQIHAYQLDRADFQAVIDGMIMDVETVIHAPDIATLDLYCDRVASAVGRLAVKVFGMQHDAGIGLAYHLGRALQLTNILRDIDEDAQLLRVYLPREVLTASGISPNLPAATIAAHPNLPNACAPLAAQAQNHFAQADAIMHLAPRATVRAPRMMSAAYRGILSKLIQRGWAAPRAPVKLARIHLAAIVLRYAFL